MLRVFCLLLLLVLPQTAWSAPQRIVALAPSVAELLLALDCGERIVGRSGEAGPELLNVSNGKATVTPLSSGSGAAAPTTIVVQSVLDGRVIAESTTKYQGRTARANG